MFKEWVWEVNVWEYIYIYICIHIHMTKESSLYQSHWWIRQVVLLFLLQFFRKMCVLESIHFCNIYVNEIIWWQGICIYVPYMTTCMYVYRYLVWHPKLQTTHLSFTANYTIICTCSTANALMKNSQINHEHTPNIHPPTTHPCKVEDGILLNA